MPYRLTSSCLTLPSLLCRPRLTQLHGLRRRRPGPAARVHPLRAEVARPGRARLSAVPEGVGAAAQRARRAGDRRGGVSRPRRSSTRPTSSILHAQEAGNIADAGRSPEPRRVPRARRRPRRHSRRRRLARSRLVQGHRRRLVARTARRSGSKARCTSTSPIATARSRKDVSNWAMDDEIYYDMDMLPEARVLAAAYTPKPLGARNAERAEARRRAHRRRQAREHLRHPAADVDLRAHRRRRRARRIARSCRFPATSTRTSTGRTTARFSCAASPGPASARTSTSC